MAAFTAAAFNNSLRTFKRTRTKSISESFEFIKRLPTDKIWIRDENIALLLNRSIYPTHPMFTHVLSLTFVKIFRKWQTRRLVITKEELYICLLNDDVIRDWIPLSDIEAVSDLQDSVETPRVLSRPNSGSFSSKGTNALKENSANITPSHSIRDEKYMFLAQSGANGIVISTIDDGHNSGRKYYIRAGSEEARAAISGEIKKLAKEAKKKLEGKTRILWAQQKIASFMKSSIIQFTLAFMIVMVGCISRFLTENRTRQKL
jgi:hypothetical protein